MKLVPVLLVAFTLLAGCAAKDAPSNAPGNNTTTQDDTTMPAMGSYSLSLADRTPGVGVPPSTMSMSPNTLSLKLNVPVNLTITNDGSSAHDFVIDGLDVSTDNIAPGGSLSVEFTPKEAGDYTMYCSIGGSSPVGHQGQGMHGTVTVA